MFFGAVSFLARVRQGWDSKISMIGFHVRIHFASKWEVRVVLQVAGARVPMQGLTRDEDGEGKRQAIEGSCCREK